MDGDIVKNPIEIFHALVISMLFFRCRICASTFYGIFIPWKKKCVRIFMK